MNFAKKKTWDWLIDKWSHYCTTVISVQFLANIPVMFKECSLLSQATECYIVLSAYQQNHPKQVFWIDNFGRSAARYDFMQHNLTRNEDAQCHCKYLNISTDHRGSPPRTPPPCHPQSGRWLLSLDGGSPGVSISSPAAGHVTAESSPVYLGPYF